MSDELTEKERAALNALDLSEIIGPPEERIRFALDRALRYFRERNIAQTSEKMAWAEHARLVVEIERLQAIVDRQPKTADGVPITLDMAVYFLRAEGYVSERFVVEISHLLIGTRTKIGHPAIAMIAPERLYSTRKAAEAARAEVGE